MELFSNSNKKLDSVTTSTVIGEGMKIDGGVIRGSGNIRVDGEVTAEIHIDGGIIVGESGVVTGSINVTHGLVAGNIIGNVTCSQMLHLSPTSVISGDLSVGSLTMDEGAKFIGNCRMPAANPNGVNLTRIDSAAVNSSDDTSSDTAVPGI